MWLIYVSERKREREREREREGGRKFILGYVREKLLTSLYTQLLFSKLLLW